MAQAGYGGTYGGSYRLVLNVTETGVNQDGNYSSVHINAYMARVSASGGDIYNNSATGWNVSVAGNNYSGNIVYGHLANGGNVQMLSTDINVGHDANGDVTIGYSASHNPNDSPYLTTGSLSGSVGLSHINRYIGINGWNISNVTEKSAVINVSTSGAASAIDYSINGGNWINGYSGNTTNTSFEIDGLTNNTTYSVVIRVQNASGGLYTNSASQAFTTNAAVITAFSLTGLTDTSLSLSVSTNYVSDQLQYQLNQSGNWITLVSQDFTTTTGVISGLTSNSSYDVTIQARHKDDQQYTPSITKTAKTSYPTPTQSTNLSPSNGNAVSTLTPTLSWQFTSTSTDSQGAYEVIVYNQSTGAAVWDSGKITSTVSSTTVPSSLLAYDNNYQWKVQTWSSANVQGVYTGLSLFKISHAPTTIITAPTSLEDFSNDTPVFSWTYTDIENTPQSKYTINVQQIVATGQTSGVSVFSITNIGTATSFSMVPGILESGNRYIVTVTTFDSDGIQSSAVSQEFTITFVGPAKPNINVSLSEDELYATISVMTNKPDDDSYETDQVHVFKRIQGTAPWTQIGTISTTSNYLDDYESLNNWTSSPSSASLSLSNIVRKGNSSMSLIDSSFGVATYTNASMNAGSILGYDKVRVWVRPTDVSIVGSIEFRFGTDVNNYYSFTVQQLDLLEDSWNSIEVDFNNLSVVGGPTLSNVMWEQIVLTSHTPNAPSEEYGAKYNRAKYGNPDGTPLVTSTATNVASGVILVDGFRVVSDASQSFIYDYNLANGKTYEYSASSFTSQENIESGKEISSDVITINYSTYKNTFIIPVGEETSAITAFMTGDDMPTFSSKGNVTYYQPVGSRTPVVYSIQTQNYITGAIKLLFLDSQLNCSAIDAVHSLQAIMNLKPLLLRTWWGDNYYISIDGQLSISKNGILGWNVEFDFTEIQNDTE